MQILSLIQDRFVKALEDLVDEPHQFAHHVAAARDPRHGDYQANLAMPLKKLLGRNPLEIAEELISRVELEDICESPEVAGPGFINLRLRQDFLAQQLTAMGSHERLGIQLAQPKTYVIDYSSPNVAKPMHVGHLRTTVIGDALAQILRFLGHKVISDNHLGDWGTQFGMIIYGYKNFCDKAAFDSQPVAELSRLYRVVQAIVGYQAAVTKLPAAIEKVELADQQLEQVHASPAPDAKQQKKLVKAAERARRNAQGAVEDLQTKVDAVKSDPELLRLAEEHSNIEKSSQLETAKLHEGDEENLDLWKQFIPISLQEIDAVYQRLGIEFDHTFGESFYHPMLPSVVQRLVEGGMAREDNGAVCVFLDEFETPMIVQKSDGAFLYSTTDIATIEYRMEHFQPDAILYVVDHRQGEHFAKTLRGSSSHGPR